MSKLLASLMRNYFPKRSSGAPLHTLSKLYDVPVGFVTPPPIFWLCIAFFAVAEGWLLLDIGWFVLFFEHPLVLLFCFALWTWPGEWPLHTLMYMPLATLMWSNLPSDFRLGIFTFACNNNTENIHSIHTYLLGLYGSLEGTLLWYYLWLICKFLFFYLLD